MSIPPLDEDSARGASPVPHGQNLHSHPVLDHDFHWPDAAGVLPIQRVEKPNPYQAEIAQQELRATPCRNCGNSCRRMIQRH